MEENSGRAFFLYFEQNNPSHTLTVTSFKVARVVILSWFLGTNSFIIW